MTAVADAFEMWGCTRMLRIPWIARRTCVNIQGTQNNKAIIYLSLVLEYFEHIAKKRSDNLEKLVTTGKGRSRSYWKLVRPDPHHSRCKDPRSHTGGW